MNRVLTTPSVGNGRDSSLHSIEETDLKTYKGSVDHESKTHPSYTHVWTQENET